MVHMVLVAYVIRLTRKVFKKLPFISFPRVYPGESAWPSLQYALLSLLDLAWVSHLVPWPSMTIDCLLCNQLLEFCQSPQPNLPHTPALDQDTHSVHEPVPLAHLPSVHLNHFIPLDPACPHILSIREGEKDKYRRGGKGKITIRMPEIVC